MMGRHCHRLLFRPLISRRVIFVDPAPGLQDWRQACENVHLAPCRCARYLLGRLGKGRELYPFSLGVNSGCRQDEDNHKYMRRQSPITRAEPDHLRPRNCDASFTFGATHPQAAREGMKVSAGWTLTELNGTKIKMTRATVSPGA